MNQDTKVLIVMISSLFATIALGYALKASGSSPIYEDQMTVCNGWEVCQTIDTDDYMNRDSLNELWDNFDNEIDTFGIDDLGEYD